MAIKRPAAAILAGLFGLLNWACPQPRSTALPLIEPVEAVHLAEAQVPELSVTSVKVTEIAPTPGYLVEGTAAGASYSVEVDAKVARVQRVTRDGGTVYQWPGIIVAGHRGTVTLAPENTLAAIEKAIELGADLIEIDVRETADGELVIIHDATLERTTNGAGLVREKTLAELKQLDAGGWFDSRFAGERIPTLREALEAMKGRAMPDLDFKAGTPRKLVSIAREFGLLGKVTLYCGAWPLLRSTLLESPGFQIRPTVPFGKLGLGTLLKEFDPPIVNINWEEFSEPLVREVHLHGRKAFLNVMGANDTEFGMLKAIEAGADYLQTDHLDVLMPLLRERGLHR